MDPLTIAIAFAGLAMLVLAGVLVLRRPAVDAAALEAGRREAIAEAERNVAVLEEAIKERDRALAQAEARVAEREAELERAKAEAAARTRPAQPKRQPEEESPERLAERARKLLLEAMERSTPDFVAEATVAVVPLPSEDMKGRIIGRDGRNIRAFEQITGVELLVDESPDSVTLSTFDPVRREAARLTLTRLIADGRIHPSRIEEIHAQAQTDVEAMMAEAGPEAARRAGVSGLKHAALEALGRLRFRTSYGQNVLDHSVEVARLAGMLADELGLDSANARRAGLLHDIGKALGPEWTGPHALTGMEFLRSAGETEPVLNAVGAHHREIEPSYPESTLVIVADSVSGSRPGARRESIESYVKRIAALEELALGFAGVQRCFAIQAGREIRVLVRPEQVDDAAAIRLADELAEKIEADYPYPGQVKVVVIRETRVQRTAG